MLCYTIFERKVSITMTNEELGKLENQMIKLLDWHRKELAQCEVFLKKEGENSHLRFIHDYEQGAINAMKDCIDIIRKEYSSVWKI